MSYILEDEKLMDFSSCKLFNVVIDLEKYPNFLPWCAAINIKEHNDDLIIADMLVNFNGLKGEYTSKVTFSPPANNKTSWIKAEGTKGIFKSLYNLWTFVPQGTDRTLVKFYICCEFRSRMLQSAFNIVHKRAQEKIIEAFKKRAEVLN